MEQMSIWREFSARAYHIHFKMVLVVVLWSLIINFEIGMGIEYWEGYLGDRIDKQSLNRCWG